MKIRVKFKDPDRLQDAVEDAISRAPKPEGVTESEWRDIQSARTERYASDITDQWMEYGEYLDIEFDTDEGTAIVLPAGTIG
jgi:hypothetical protein